jgi:hypothetical protein
MTGTLYVVATPVGHRGHDAEHPQRWYQFMPPVDGSFVAATAGSNYALSSNSLWIRVLL